MRVFPLLALVALLVGCRASERTAKAPVKPPPPLADPWKIVGNDPTAEEPALLWNGLIGVRIGRDGTGNGLPFFTIDEYETVGEEKIRTLPNPLQIEWYADGVRLRPGEHYEQTLDMRTGKLLTRWEQTVNGKRVIVDCTTVVHPNRRVIDQVWFIGGHNGTPIEMRSGYEGARITPDQQTSPRRLTWSVRLGEGLQAVVSHTAPDEEPPGWSSVGNQAIWKGRVSKEHAVLVRTVSFGQSRNVEAMGPPFRPREAPVAGEGRDSAGVDHMVEEEAKAVWSQRWRTDIEIDGPVEDQQAIRSFLFFLQSSLHPEGRMSVSPFALSHGQYNGHVFWDADIWVFPALSLVAPDRAKAMADYRLRLAPAARENFRRWEAAGRPTSSGRLGPLPPGQRNGLMFPWESSVTGHETVPGPSRFEHHITGSVLWMLERAAALGLANPRAVADLGHGAAVFWAVRSQQGNDGLEVRDVMSPDENHVGDNDLYTNLLAQHAASRYGSHSKPPRYKLPRDEKSFLTYDNDALRGYKQAAAVLAIYPLQYPKAENQARVMMDRFADKVTANGPAMTDSVHALIWARLGETDKAYETWRKSWQDFVKPPHLLFSEKRRKVLTYFTTGAGGCLQTVLFGFLGLRIDEKPLPGALWKLPLENGLWLSAKPNLPRAWKRVTFRNMQVLGKRYTLTATHEGLKVTKGD